MYEPLYLTNSTILRLQKLEISFKKIYNIFFLSEQLVLTGRNETQILFNNYRTIKPSNILLIRSQGNLTVLKKKIRRVKFRLTDV